MAALKTPRVTPGWKAVDFHLKGTDGKVYTLADVKAPRAFSSCSFATIVLSCRQSPPS